MYAKFWKRVFDFMLSLLALIVLSPLLLLLTIVGAITMRGNPFFTQIRPGKKDKNGREKLFKLFKFRTMSNKKDKDGILLPDEVRLNKYGKFLRSTSLDELPELMCIICGDMAVIGPRPQLVRDMVFMTEEQRHRHDVRPGLSGLAQIRGRNTITWEGKLTTDLEYIKHITLLGDIKIIFLTMVKVFKREGISEEGKATADDLGDYLLNSKAIYITEYMEMQQEVKRILGETLPNVEQVVIKK